MLNASSALEYLRISLTGGLEYARMMEPQQLLLTLSTTLVAGFVFFASVCRLRFLHASQHQPLVVTAYGLMTFGAGALMVEAWVYEMRLTELALLAGLALWLWATRFNWREGPPRYLERAAPRGA